jgi:hypothetical protein
MTKKVLSFDVGIINLAYCLLEINQDQTFKILKWGVIDLADDRRVCEHMKTNKQKCGKIARHVLKLDKCCNYYCKAHASKAGLSLTLRPITVTWNQCIASNNDKCNMCDKYGEYVSNIFDGKYCMKHRKSITSTNNYICCTKKCNNCVTRGILEENQKLNIGWCDDHYDQGFKEFIKKKTKGISQNSNKISLMSIGKSMYEKLDSIPDLLMVDEVLIENQPTFINPTMKSVSAFLFSYFIMRGIHEKEKTGSTISNISFCSPSNKIKVGGDQANQKLDNVDDDKVYKITKNLGIQFCKALIDDNQGYLDILDSHKKQDDMADAFLQGFIMSLGPVIPKHYADKIKNIDCSEEIKITKKTKKHTETETDTKTDTKTNTKINTKTDTETETEAKAKTIVKKQKDKMLIDKVSIDTEDD